MCDDALQMDLRLIKGFLMDKLYCEDVYLTYQSLYLSREENRYIALTKTCRCIAIKYIKEGRLIQDCYLPVSTEKDEIEQEMKQLHSDIDLEKIPVFIVETPEISESISGFGKVIGCAEIMENYNGMYTGR